MQICKILRERDGRDHAQQGTSHFTDAVYMNSVCKLDAIPPSFPAPETKKDNNFHSHKFDKLKLKRIVAIYK